MPKTAIITAMREEANHIIQKYKLTQTKGLQNLSVYESAEIVLILAGIGKIQAAIGTSYALENYEIWKIINIGIAGSLLGNEANIGDVFLVSKIVQHDMYLPFDGPHLDYAKKAIEIPVAYSINTEKFTFKAHEGAICLTGDQFIDDAEKVGALREKYRADVCEMEAFSIASVAREYGKLENCIFIKAISDGADSDARDAHMGNLDFAMKNSLEVLEEILKV